MRYRISFAVSWCVAGMIVAPSLHSAIEMHQYSQRRFNSTITLSPWPMPRDRSAFAVLSLRRLMSANVKIRSSPLSSHSDERAFFGFDTRPFVHNVVGKVKALRHNDLKILLEILVGRELQPVTESFDQNWLPPAYMTTTSTLAGFPQSPSCRADGQSRSIGSLLVYFKNGVIDFILNAPSRQ